MARIRHQVTAADIAPDGRRLAVMTYNEVLLYRRRGDEPWADAVARKPAVHDLPWLPQAEALGWDAAGRGLYATGEIAHAVFRNAKGLLDMERAQRSEAREQPVEQRRARGRTQDGHSLQHIPPATRGWRRERGLSGKGGSD